MHHRSMLFVQIYNAVYHLYLINLLIFNLKKKLSSKYIIVLHIYKINCEERNEFGEMWLGRIEIWVGTGEN